MNMRFIAALSLVASLGFVAQTASAGTLLVGFHEFGDHTRGKSNTKNSADEGLFAANSSITYCFGSSSSGGSTDNWYGADNVANGGHLTNQTTGKAVTGGSSGSPLTRAGSSEDGRVHNLNGTDIFVTNNTSFDYRIDTLLFDAFLDGVSDSLQTGLFTKFPVTVFRNDGSMDSSNFEVTKAYAGSGMQNGESVDQSLSNPSLIDNRPVYGVGSNYIDYHVDLGGFLLKPGESFSLGFNFIGVGAARGDNFAIIGTPVPEPMTALVFSGMLGAGLLDRRRRK